MRSVLAVGDSARDAALRADSKIDHVTIAGSDVKQMQAKLAAVGIASVYGGAHSNHATEMALVSFPDGSYLELMGIQPNADAAAVARHVWAKFAERERGAVRLGDAGEESGRGGEPVEGGGDHGVGAGGAAGARVPTACGWNGRRPMWAGDTRGTFFPVPDPGPDAARAAGLSAGQAGDEGVPRSDARGDRGAQSGRCDQTLPAGLRRPAADQTGGPEFRRAYLALLGNLPVVLAQPLNAGSWLTERIERFGEGPCAFVLGAVNPRRFQAASKTRWFGAEISWFDAEKLGWRLGFEAAR